MEFDEVIVKDSPGVCRCCLSEGCYKDLSTEYTWMNENEVYADMLLECFDISISQQIDGPNGPNRLICEVCITQLRDACNFKKQVLATEKKFVDMVARGEFAPKMIVFQQNLKTEINVENGPNFDVEAEYLDDDFAAEDDEPLKSVLESQRDTTSTTPAKLKRGRPRKAADIKTEKKPKLKSTKEERPTSSKPVKKGETDEAENKSSMSATKRNRLMKRNASIILETSTLLPFKWHRQSYLCFFCHQSFKDTEMLKDHTKEKHKKSNIKSAVSYLRRDEKVKVDVTEMLCRLCGSNLQDLDNLVHHIKIVHHKCVYEEFGYGVLPYKLQENNFQCAVCQKSFQYFIKLNQHMNEHYGNFICESCGKSFLSQDRLKCHTLSHISDFRCSICLELFESMSQKNNHESKVHNREKNLKCFYCKETFNNYSFRKKHHKEIHNIAMPEFDCPVCGKTFQIMSKMRVHYKEVHAKEKNFSCNLCDQKFFSRTHVQKHMIKHYGDRIHNCDVCKKSYARKQTLRDHMRIHSNDKKYSCGVCNLSFAQHNSLKLHLKVHHVDTTVSNNTLS